MEEKINNPLRDKMFNMTQERLNVLLDGVKRDIKLLLKRKKIREYRFLEPLHITWLEPILGELVDYEAHSVFMDSGRVWLGCSSFYDGDRNIELSCLIIHSILELHKKVVYELTK